MQQRFYRQFLAFVAGLCCSFYAIAQQSTEEQTEPPVEVRAEGFNAAQERIIDIRQNDTFDWIRLVSGEWLKGEFKALYEKIIEFESDILETLYIDFEDVDSIISGREHSVLLRDGTELVGELTIFDNVVRVGDSNDTYDLRDILTIANVADGDRFDLWSARVSAGLNLTRGNTEKVEWSAQAQFDRRTATSRLNIEILSYRTTDNNEVTKDNERVSANFDMFRDEKVYWRPGYIEFYRDPFQNIRGRYNVGAGAGYYIIDDYVTEWSVTAGPAYLFTRFDTVAEGQQKREKSASLFFETHYDTEITKDIDVEFDYQYLLAKKEAGGSSHHAKLTFKTDITDDIDFDTSLVWDRLENPEPDSDGVVPKKDDFILIFKLGIEF